MQLHRTLVAACTIGALAGPACAQTYQAVALPQGTAVAMSSCGWVTGNVGRNAFIYHDGAFQLLPTDAFYAKAVNNHGDVAGYVVGGKVTAVNTAVVFLFGADGAHGIYRVNGFNSSGNGLNDAVMAVGAAVPVRNPAKLLPFTFFAGQTTTLERRNPQTLAGINSSQQIVGTQVNAASSQAFVYDGSYSFLNVTGATSTVGLAINEAGAVVGHGLTPDGLDQGFVYANGSGSLIGAAPNAYHHGSSLLALNNLGQAVGTISNDSGATHALLYTSGSFTDLNDVADAPEPLVSAVGISDGGEIVANAASGAAYLLVPGGVYPPNTCLSP